MSGSSLLWSLRDLCFCQEHSHNSHFPSIPILHLSCVPISLCSCCCPSKFTSKEIKVSYKQFQTDYLLTSKRRIVWRTWGRINFSNKVLYFWKSHLKYGSRGLLSIRWGQNLTPRENSCNIPLPTAISKPCLSAAYKSALQQWDKNSFFFVGPA